MTTATYWEIFETMSVELDAESKASKEVVLRFLKFMSTGTVDDQEAAGRVFAEDAEFFILGIPTTYGRDNIMTHHFRPGRSTMVPGSKTLKVGTVVTEGEYVAAEWMSHRKLMGGGEYQNLFFGLFHVKNGHIQSLREYRDTLVAKEAKRPGTETAAA